jgi:exo-1,4-beta-D-glucosaminidase
MTKFISVATVFVVAGLTCAAAVPEGAAPPAKLVLSGGWFILPSTEVAEKGEALSSATFQPKHWYPAKMPSTVMAALVANQVYADPFVGMNLRAVDGVKYPIGHNFSSIPMPPGSPFRSSWWYRTQFTVPAEYKDRRIHLHFDGINFRANVWLNGKLVADSQRVAGAWRLFEFDVTGIASPGAPNGLAVEVFPPTPEDLAITFVDWNPAPPDKAMGIWRDVYLTASGPVSIRFPQVITKLDLPAADKAHLTVTAELRNTTNHAVKGVLSGEIEDVKFSQDVALDREQVKVVTFSPEQFAQLNLTNPRLWWPAQVGPQNLYGLKLRFETGNAISDQVETRFGVREVSGELDAQKHTLFKINGKTILIRGGGYTFDMFLRTSPDKQEAILNYVRDMNLNSVRLEGKIEDDNFFRLADEKGILVMAGWCCCDHWEQWGKWDDEDRLIAAESLRDQIRRLRSHPAVFDWMNGSDNPPPPDVETMYIGILKELNWPNPYQSSATTKTTTVTGETGVKMLGPYDYVPPSYWLLDTKLGGAYGFDTEVSPGAAVPPIESLREMLPADRLWPINSAWDYHAGGGVFSNLDYFTGALNARYGESKSVEEYAMKSQLLAYEGERAMFEAFGRNKYTSTGVIQWMLNNAWPSMIWHLFDSYMRPGGSYFGAKKGCEPIHIQYSYDDRSVAVVNSFYKDFQGLKASTKVYNLDLSEKYSKETTLDVPSDGVVRAFTLPEIDGLSTTYFVRLSLSDAAGKTLSTNFYWLSTKPDVMDWDQSTWYNTPVTSHADLTGLATLPAVELRVSATSEAQGDDGVTRVVVENPGKSLAFPVHLKAIRPAAGPEGHAREVLPVLWEDNYFALMPGEKREIIATYRKANAGSRPLIIEVDGGNVSAKPVAADAR